MTLRRFAAPLALVIVAAGCGGGDETAAPTTPATSTPTESHAHEAAVHGPCRGVGLTEEGRLRLCRAPNEHGTFVVGEGDAAEPLAIPPPGSTPSASDAGRAGHWEWAALSPDASTLLAQWRAECEVPIAFFVSLPAGSPRPVTGETDWAKSPNSEALGWTTDGRAIVFLPRGPACGVGAGRPGVYLYQAPGAGKRLVATQGGSTFPMRRSRAPRDEEELVDSSS